jgi:hypothetical protein
VRGADLGVRGGQLQLSQWPAPNRDAAALMARNGYTLNSSSNPIWMH